MSAVTSSSSSSAAVPDQHYNFTRGSTAATRALIDSNPASKHASGTATPSDPTSPHGTLHRRKTNNYETALADRLSATIAADDTQPAGATSGAQPVVASGLAYRGDSAAAQQPAHTEDTTSTGPITSDAGANDRPLLGVLGRQQSFKQDDQKRQQMERMLSSDGAKRGGYSTNQPVPAV
ncbi:hypothetical protein K461DRAFT_277250 [Myriangium duriaei CBS 260.36]|uniref:Uncharacterized protein n=1 Tax=Myriangium duriaei CBS 260.36 TaxID=1168546 RepID=A0A9P4J3M1_9PEZI|nr:hypothetical protein K461DRAFT_277250 [Myriangium duriaei CBS 260.36]